MGSKIPERLCELLIWFYSKFPTGGFLHIVTDDGNWEAEHIVWCLLNWERYCTAEDKRWLATHESEIIEMCTLILELPEKQRHYIWDAVDYYKEEANG